MKRAGEPRVLSVVLSSLPFEFEPALQSVRELGFSYVDVIGLVRRPSAHLEVLAESGLLVSCGALGYGLAQALALDARSVANRRRALEEMKQQVADLARLGATNCSVTPGNDDSREALSCYSQACSLLADFAGQRMMRLCIEHRHGSALPSARAAVNWLKQAGHSNLQLLLDISQCAAGGEDPECLVEQAGAHLGYVRLPASDGESADFVGVLKKLFAALRAQRYDGALALEVAAESPNPLQNLQPMKVMIERLLAME